MLKKELAMSGSTGADGTAPGAVAGPGLKELLQENFHLTQQVEVPFSTRHKFATALFWKEHAAFINIFFILVVNKDSFESLF